MKQDRLLRRISYEGKPPSIVPISCWKTSDLAKYQQVLVEKKKEPMRKIKEGAEIDGYPNRFCNVIYHGLSTEEERARAKSFVYRYDVGKASLKGH